MNVGAGAGAYEPSDVDVVAIEPSSVMLAQRPLGAARAIQGVAERIPLGDDSVDAAMAIISDHLWTDRSAGLRELRRVARKRVVLVNADPARADGFWLTRLYLPAFSDLIPIPYREPGYWQQELSGLLGAITETPLPVPHDCADGFYQAYWRRPRAYLDARVRANISVFHRLPPGAVEHAVAHLARDVDSGAWQRRHADLMTCDALDVGFRIVVAELA